MNPSTEETRRENRRQLLALATSLNPGVPLNKLLVVSILCEKNLWEQHAGNSAAYEEAIRAKLSQLGAALVRERGPRTRPNKRANPRTSKLLRCIASTPSTREMRSAALHEARGFVCPYATDTLALASIATDRVCRAMTRGNQHFFLLLQPSSLTCFVRLCGDESVSDAQLKCFGESLRALIDEVATAAKCQLETEEAEGRFRVFRLPLSSLLHESFTQACNKMRNTNSIRNVESFVFRTCKSSGPSLSASDPVRGADNARSLRCHTRLSKRVCAPFLAPSELASTQQGQPPVQ